MTTPDRPPPAPWWHTALRIGAGVLVVIVLFAVLKSRFPDPRQFWDALKSANWRWVGAALLLELFSIGMMIRQQRRLMRAFGVDMTYARMGAITYSSTAISMSVPAGGAISAGYAYRKFRASGASTSTAASVMLLSGVFSVSALVLLYLLGALLAAWTRLGNLGTERPVLTVVLGIVVVAVIVLLIRWLARSRRHLEDDTYSRTTPRLDRYEQRHPRLGAAGRHALDALRRAGKVRPLDWNVALTQSLANWLLDAASLYAATLAFELDIDLWALALLYLGVQVVRQIPLTPGGIGLIEASLLAGLISAGAAQGPAAAAVVIYRLFSCWLLIPIGFTFMGMLSYRDRRRPRPAEQQAEPAASAAATVPDTETDTGSRTAVVHRPETSAP